MARLTSGQILIGYEIANDVKKNKAKQTLPIRYQT